MKQRCRLQLSADITINRNETNKKKNHKLYQYTRYLLKLAVIEKLLFFVNLSMPGLVELCYVTISPVSPEGRIRRPRSLVTSLVRFVTRSTVFQNVQPA